MKTDKNDLVVIELDRPRFLRYGHKALKKLTALTGKSLKQIGGESFALEDLEKILYCGLLSDARDNNEELKLEDMEDLLDHAASFQELTDKMSEAFEKAFGVGTVEEAKTQAAKKAKN